MEPLRVEPESVQNENDSRSTHSDPLLGSSPNWSIASADRSDFLTVFPAEEKTAQNSMVSLGKFGDYDDREDATLTIEDAKGKIAGTFSLTGNGYGQVFCDDRHRYVSFWGTDGTTSVRISAKDDLKFNDYIGASLRVQSQGSITTHNILSKGGTIDLTSTKSVTSQGQIDRESLLLCRYWRHGERRRHHPQEQ
jgi:hypothetical protein